MWRIEFVFTCPAFWNRDNQRRFAQPHDFEPQSAEVPEIIDLKITDYCENNCQFCYQNSGRKGKHADFAVIKAILNTAAYYKVPEIVLGGGEPTLHPEFKKILLKAHRNRLIPSFTTKSTKWLRNRELVEIVNKAVGAFAYSVKSDYAVNDFMEMALKAGIDRNKIRFHRN